MPASFIYLFLIVQENLSGTTYDISSIPFSVVEFDHSGSYLAVAGSDIRYAFNAGHILPCVFIFFHSDFLIFSELYFAIKHKCPIYYAQVKLHFPWIISH